MLPNAELKLPVRSERNTQQSIKVRLLGRHRYIITTNIAINLGGLC